MGGLDELSLPESLAGRLESQIEARASIESQSVDSFRRLDVFLGGLLAALKQMDADMQSVKQENGRLAAQVKQAHQRLDEKFAEVDEKTVQTQIDLAACQTAEAILTQKVRAVEAELNQSILDTLAREKNFENQLHAMEKRVPTSSQASAAKQKGGKVQVTSVGEVRTESTSLETQPETNTEGDAGTAQLEKAMLERLSALRSDLHQQSKELQETMNANRLKSDSEIEVLKNGLAEQNKRLRYVDKISRTSAGVVLKYLPGSGLNKELEAQKKDLEVLLAHGLLEGNIEADLIDEIANLRMHLGSLEEKLAKMLEKNEAAEIEAAAQKKSQKQAVVASADAAGDAEAAEAADEPANADALASHNTANELPEMDILVQRVSSLESHKDELLMEIHRIKEETNNTNVKLANFEGEFQNSSRRRHEKCSAATTKDSEQSAKVPSDASEDPLDALERQLRREIESVTAQLQALDKRVSDQESPENHGARAADGTGGPDAGVPPKRSTHNDIRVILEDLRTSMYKQIGHERDSRAELEHRVQARLEQAATHDDIARMADAAAEAKEVSKKTQDEMVNMSMGLRVFMTETEEKLNSKADAKALLQKAGWTEVRDLMGELSAHLSEKLHQSSSTFKGLNEKISNMEGKQRACGSVKCISCARFIAPSPSRSAAIWSKNPLDPELSGGAEEHVHRMKIASAHLYIADKMPAIESAQKGSTQGPHSTVFGDDGVSRTSPGGLPRNRSPKRGRSEGKYVPWTPDIRSPPKMQ